MKKLLAILLALAMCFALVACGGGNSGNAGNAGNAGDSGNASTNTDSGNAGGGEADAEPVKVAILTCLTGSNKETGDRSQRSVNYAVEQINADGGICGRPVEAVYFDIGADQQSFINALQAAVNTEGVIATIGYSMSAYTVAGSDIILESKLPNFCCGNSSNIVGLNNPYIWQMRMLDSGVTETMAKVAYENYGARNTAVLWMTNSAGQSQHDAFQRVWDSYSDAEIVLDMGFDQANTSDFTPHFTQIMDSDADSLVVFCTNQQDGILIAETDKQFNCNLPTGSSPGNLAYSFVENISDGAAEGWFGLSEFNVEATTPGLADFLAEMAARDKQGLGTPGWSETAYYDAMFIIDMICEQVGSTDPQALNDGMVNLKDYQGMMTSYSYHEDRSLANYAWLATIENNGIVMSEQVFR